MATTHKHNWELATSVVDFFWSIGVCRLRFRCTQEPGASFDSELLEQARARVAADAEVTRLARDCSSLKERREELTAELAQLRNQFDELQSNEAAVPLDDHLENLREAKAQIAGIEDVISHAEKLAEVCRKELVSRIEKLSSAERVKLHEVAEASIASIKKELPKKIAAELNELANIRAAASWFSFSAAPLLRVEEALRLAAK